MELRYRHRTTQGYKGGEEGPKMANDGRTFLDVLKIEVILKPLAAIIALAGNYCYISSAHVSLTSGPTHLWLVTVPLGSIHQASGRGQVHQAQALYRFSSQFRRTRLYFRL
jgi:hypothetical protein